MEKLRLGLKKVQDEVKRRAVEADDTRLNSYIFARQATGDDAKLLDQYMTHLENMKKIPWYSLQEKKRALEEEKRLFLLVAEAQRLWFENRKNLYTEISQKLGDNQGTTQE